MTAEVAASILMKVQNDSELRVASGIGRSRTDQQHGPGHSRAHPARRQADSLRQRRLGHRCQRLGDRLRFAA